MQIVESGTEGEGASEKKEDQKKDAKNQKVAKDDDGDKNKDGAEKGKNKDKDEKNENGKDKKDNAKEKKKPPKKPTIPPKKASSEKAATEKGNPGNQSPKLDKLNELNPSSIISDLKNTPADKLKNIEPLLKNLAENLQGTNLGNYFSSLTSIVKMSGLKSVLQFFPNLISTTFNFVAQLGSLLPVAIGRFGKTVVDLLDILFNGVKSLLALVSPIVRLIPGGKTVLNAANDGVKTLHSATVDPVDDAADALKTTGKSLLKRLSNVQSKRQL